MYSSELNTYRKSIASPKEILDELLLPSLDEFMPESIFEAKHEFIMDIRITATISDAKLWSCIMIGQLF